MGLESRILPDQAGLCKVKMNLLKLKPSELNMFSLLPMEARLPPAWRHLQQMLPLEPCDTAFSADSSAALSMKPLRCSSCSMWNWLPASFLSLCFVFSLVFPTTWAHLACSTCFCKHLLLPSQDKSSIGEEISAVWSIINICKTSNRWRNVY